MKELSGPKSTDCIDVPEDFTVRVPLTSQTSYVTPVYPRGSGRLKADFGPGRATLTPVLIYWRIWAASSPVLEAELADLTNAEVKVLGHSVGLEIHYQS